ncbi:MAG: hypothetical protein LBK43_05670 [Treponema sp.]|jgi:hypothetical protein|nr:hypothetical protein [Treponema sp.]
MKEYLLVAECVIMFLSQAGIIENCTDWKGVHPKMANSNGLIIFDIEVKNGQFFVSKSRTKIIAHKYGFNEDEIYTKCAI